MIRLEPELTWREGRFRPGVAVVADPATGRIVDVEERGAESRGPESRGAEGRRGTDADDLDVLALPGRALLPGFVNAHSHAFQRGIRGRTQWRRAGDAGTGADFWSWREAMYGAALTLSAEDVYDIARFAFLEMLRTGITAVGEFHYLHHQPDGSLYPDPNELATRVIAAAEAVGVRITLLNVCYATGGIDRPLEGRQRRFRARSVDEYLDRTAALLESLVEAPLASVGVAPHSVRAVPREWLPDLREWARQRDAPFHMHVAEQPAEIEAATRAWGLRPVEVLAADGLLDDGFTAVHATHMTDGEVERLGATGATVCACPTTERDLGDGFLRGFDLIRAGVPLALGTDSHTSLDFFAEMRLVEYHERLTRLRRVVIAEEADGRAHVGPALLRMATVGGARSLRLDVGRIEVGALADLVAVDLTHPSILGWTRDTLADALALSATPDVVRDVWTHGVRRLKGGRHPADGDIAAAFAAAARRLPGPEHAQPSNLP